MKDPHPRPRSSSLNITVVSKVLTCIFLVTFRIWNKTKYLPSYPKRFDVCGNFSTYLEFVSAEPIDIVYTWVNGSDEMFLESMSNYVELSEVNKNRFNDHHELMFSLRSIEKFVPWIRHIYIVTNGQIPHWLNLENNRISVVSHIEICPPELIERALPTFSSSAIEMMLHRIPKLSERFLYMNDDFYVGKPLLLEDLRTDSDGIYTTPAWPFLYCSETCKWKHIGDNVCNEECYNLACNFDGGDCQSISASVTLTNDEVAQFLKEYHNVSTLNRTHVEHVCEATTKWNNGENFMDVDTRSCDVTLLNCTTFVNQFRKKFGSVRKFKATTHPDAGAFSEYAIITSDLDRAKRTFNRLLTVRKTFNCINDVIEPTSANYFDSDEFKEISELWLQFYLKLFPDPSEFELPNGVRNSYRYTNECPRAT